MKGARSACMERPVPNKSNITLRTSLKSGTYAHTQAKRFKSRSWGKKTFAYVLSDQKFIFTQHPPCPESYLSALQQRQLLAQVTSDGVWRRDGEGGTNRPRTGGRASYG